VGGIRMKLLRIFKTPRDPNALYIATSEYPDVEFRVDITVHDTKDKVVTELKRRIEEMKKMERPPKPPVEKEIEDAIKAGEEF